jgi:hydrogenase maturation protein HypF
VLQRLHACIRGAVQGVGFRPFVYRLATDCGLTGWVLNSSEGVFLDVEGPQAKLEEFMLRIAREAPPRAWIQSAEFSWRDPAGYTTFEIRTSDDSGPKTALVLPDCAICPDCLREIMDPHDRRYRYPFTNCTNCGPRYSILERLPYDRPNTTMRMFAMCPDCRKEYDDPRDRRFHAQPNACPVCGPRLEFWDPQGTPLASEDDALRRAVDVLRNGSIVAVKGIGGFHLMADAGNATAVRLLRTRKAREEKPFAVMCPSVESTRTLCEVTPMEERLLTSPESPIVLLTRRPEQSPLVCNDVAPGNPALGVMLPYAPLHHLLLCGAGIPLVATSGNRSDEPICTDEREALRRLAGIADFFLVHNRPIARHVDDSIVRMMAGRELVLRRARGYAPLPVMLDAPGDDLLAVGAHLKNTVAVARGNAIFVSQHLGDLETPEAFEAFRREIGRLEELFAAAPVAVVSDLHPDYLSSSYARSRTEPVITVQHHVAHVAACMAENGIAAPALGVAWDGTGLGTDGTVWGGEWFAAEAGGFRRAAHLRTFPLPGGDRAAREPRRSALGLLYTIFGADAFNMTELAPVGCWNAAERTTLRQMLEQSVNAPLTSSAGRLFDAVGALTGLRLVNAFEGQAAMELEWQTNGRSAGQYAFTCNAPATENGPLVVDWEPMIIDMLSDLHKGTAVGEIAARFHGTLAAMIVTVAERCGMERVALSGGCFQNRVLTEATIDALRIRGFQPYWHQRIPPNDGGIAVGQIVVAAKERKKAKGRRKNE